MPLEPPEAGGEEHEAGGKKGKGLKGIPLWVWIIGSALLLYLTYRIWQANQASANAQQQLAAQGSSSGAGGGVQPSDLASALNQQGSQLSAQEQQDVAALEQQLAAQQAAFEAGQQQTGPAISQLQSSLASIQSGMNTLQQSIANQQNQSAAAQASPDTIKSLLESVPTTDQNAEAKFAAGIPIFINPNWKHQVGVNKYTDASTPGAIPYSTYRQPGYDVPSNKAIYGSNL